MPKIKFPYKKTTWFTRKQGRVFDELPAGTIAAFVRDAVDTKISQTLTGAMEHEYENYLLGKIAFLEDLLETIINKYNTKEIIPNFLTLEEWCDLRPRVKQD